MTVAGFCFFCAVVGGWAGGWGGGGGGGGGEEIGLHHRYARP